MANRRVTFSLPDLHRLRLQAIQPNTEDIDEEAFATFDEETNVTATKYGQTPHRSRRLSTESFDSFTSITSVTTVAKTLRSMGVGKYCSNLLEFQEIYSQVPADYQTRFANASSNVCATLTSPANLSVYHIGGTASELLLVAIAAGKTLSTQRTVDGKTKKCAVVIIVDDDPSNTKFVTLVSFLGSRLGLSYYGDNDTKRFGEGRLIVCRGLTASGPTLAKRLASQSTLEASSTRVRQLVAQTLFKMGATGYVWRETHSSILLARVLFDEGARLGWDEVTISAVTITSGVTLSTASCSINHSLHGPTSLDLVRQYCERSNTPIVHTDFPTLGLGELAFLSQLDSFATSWPALLPEPTYLQGVYQTLDNLTHASFALRGALSNRHGAAIAQSVRVRLPPRAKTWANRCIDPAAYPAPECSVDAAKKRLFSMVTASKCPMMQSPSALAPLLVDLGRSETKGLLAARVEVNFAQERVRLKTDSNTYLLVATDLARVSERLKNIWASQLRALQGRYSGVRNPKVENGVMYAWGDMENAVLQQLRWVRDLRAGQKEGLGEEEVRQVGEVIGGLERGAMTAIVRRSR
ncbi:hypothetical protein LTS18_005006 [Coniosporium uncinatum]|uniref:Uncharacterized protein n=1 Tax=Coniosporium uncinatum TaxID=93489 RepID=A0ACC3DBF6_9PEZI|nr:hypothetical protein LTS18_005006 [Coniosporium uncinatum]